MQVYHGVDFSGGAKHRDKIWVSTWAPDGDRSEATTRNGFTHAELVDTIAASSASTSEHHHWLIDAPFNLAIEQLEQHAIEPATWQATIDWLASFESARDWRRACRAVSRREPKREVDRRFKTPMAPMNIRMFKQTWHCIASIVRPLLAFDHVAILPMQTECISTARVFVGEGCPGSTLRGRGWPHRGYKGPSDAAQAVRVDLLRRLDENEGIRFDDDARRIAIDDTEGDALDSLLLLPAARRFAEAGHVAILRDDPNASVEGWVYV